MTKSKCLMALLFIVVSFSTAAMPAFSQTNSTVYVRLDYMKVEPTKGQDYLKLEQEVWKPVHQERIKAGMITA